MRRNSFLLVLFFTLFVIGGVTQSTAVCVGAKCLRNDNNPTIQAPRVVEPSIPKAPIVTHGNNSCASAFNNVCDEPSNCKVGTDSADCERKQ